MTKVTNQIGKVNSEEELQKMAEKLNQQAKAIFDTGEAKEQYEAFKEMQTYFDYKEYCGEKEVYNLVFKMEAIRALFLGLHEYNQAFKKYNKGWTDITFNFKHIEIV